MTLGNGPQPLTRRQLRELARENDSASADSPPSGAAVPENTPPGADGHDHSRHTSPPVDRPAVLRSADRSAPAPLPVPAEAEVLPSARNDSARTDSARTLSRRELRALQVASSALSDDESAAAAAQAHPPVATPGRSSTGISSGDAQADSNGLHLPLGHWSVEREDDSHIQAIGRRDDQTFDDLVGRGIGSGGIPTTSNALILPSIPRQGAAGPMAGTGEIMITGSIDLPRSLGSTGQHPNLFDSSEMDRMLDQLDEDSNHNDVAPVSASRAVSTHTSTRGVMTPPRKRGASLPTILAITAAVLAIGVLSLFVVGAALRIF